MSEEICLFLSRVGFMHQEAELGLAFLMMLRDFVPG